MVGTKINLSADTFYGLMGVAASLRMSPRHRDPSEFKALSEDGKIIARELVRLSQGEVLGTSVYEQAARYFMDLTQ